MKSEIRQKNFSISVMLATFILWLLFASVAFYPHITKAEVDDEEEVYEQEIIIPQKQPVDSIENNVPVEVSPVINDQIIIAEVQEGPSALPWHITRAAAIVSYVLLFLMIILGESMVSGTVYKLIAPPQAWLIHKYLGVSFVIALLTHGISLLFDKFINFNIADILIPFHSDYKPLFLSLGIIGFYLVLIVMVSSIFRRFQHSLLWRQLHFLVYLLFIMGFAHGIVLGTDSKNIPMILLYIHLQEASFCWFYFIVGNSTFLVCGKCFCWLRVF